MKHLMLGAIAALTAASAMAQGYPEKPITIVVPFTAGGPTDKVARDFAEAMRKPLNNQSIVIDNVGGATARGVEVEARARAGDVVRKGDLLAAMEHYAARTR